MKPACESGLKVLTWFLGNAQVNESQVLELIQQWWTSLQGKTVLWQVFIEPLNCTPLFSCNYKIQDVKAHNFEFFWQRQGLEAWSSFTAKELTLNPQQQSLEIRPHALSNYRYQLTVIE